MADVRFPKPEVVITQLWIDISHRLIHFGRQIEFDFKGVPSTFPQPEVDLRRHRRYFHTLMTS